MSQIVKTCICAVAMIALLTSSTMVLADTSIRGTVEKIDGKTLRVVDQQGHAKNVHVNDQTVVVSTITKSRYDIAWLRSGSRVNVVERNGRLLVLVVEEVPK